MLTPWYHFLEFGRLARRAFSPAPGFISFVCKILVHDLFLAKHFISAFKFWFRFLTGEPRLSFELKSKTAAIRQTDMILHNWKMQSGVYLWCFFNWLWWRSGGQHGYLMIKKSWVWILLPTINYQSGFRALSVLIEWGKCFLAVLPRQKLILGKNNLIHQLVLWVLMPTHGDR